MIVHLSKQGALFIGAFEGFAKKRPDGTAECYDDPVGHCTIGYGHLVHYGRTTSADRKRIYVHGGKPGVVTHGEAAILLQADAQACTLAVSQLGVALTQAQQDALVSAAFNLGAGVLHRSSSLATAVRSKPATWNPIKIRAWHKRVQDALLLYSHAGGHVLPGLRRRRMAEAVLFRTGKYTQATGNQYANA